MRRGKEKNDLVEWFHHNIEMIERSNAILAPLGQWMDPRKEAIKMLYNHFKCYGSYSAWALVKYRNER